MRRDNSGHRQKSYRAMPWQTVDARPQKRRKGDAVEDAERRDPARSAGPTTRRRRSHAALAAKAASAPPADAVAALYEKILEDVGSAAKENEAPWDAALRLACARHLSELLEAAGDRAGALAAAAGPPTPDGTTPGCGCASRASRESRRASPRARVAVGALQRAAALRRAEREDDGALERAARAVGVSAPASAGSRRTPPPRRRRPGRCAPRGRGRASNALLAARAALARDARAGQRDARPPFLEWPRRPRDRRASSREGRGGAGEEAGRGARG